MELMWLVYGIDLLLKVADVSLWFILASFSILLIMCFIALIYYFNEDYSTEQFKTHFKKYFPLKLSIVAGVLLLLIPNQQTMKYMGAAYIVQETFESDFVQETASLSQKAIIKQLKLWAKDSPDIIPVLEEIGVEVKEKALQEVSNTLESVSK